MGIGDADPWLLAGDGKTYLWQWDEEGGEWKVSSDVPETLRGYQCSRRTVNRFISVGGDVTSCLSVEPEGEWCPWPITSFAATGDGALWIYEKEQTCELELIVGLSLVCMASFAVAGLIMFSR